jgi:hypothetical protein
MMLLSALALSLLLQATDFSGQWTVDAPPADMGSGWGSTIAIKQDARQLVVEPAIFSRYDIQPVVRIVYALDGSESRNSVTISHAAQVRTSKVTWEGQSLRISTIYPGVDPSTGKAFTTEVVNTLTLEAPDTLVVATTRAGALGGPATSARTVYKKK